MAERYANSYHGRKSKFLGNEARVAPAWKDQAKARTANGQLAPKSKIILSYLPPDVGPDEVNSLFVKTVGPVQDAFVVYNSQGNSKGMAVVAFYKPESATLARQKYNGKIIDGRRPIKIEIIKDEDDAPRANGVPQAAPSLLQRMAGPAPIFTAQPQSSKQSTKKAAASTRAPAAAASRVAANPPRKQRRKKGPKRVKKAVTVADLDAEMEDYRAQAQATEDVKD